MHFVHVIQFVRVQGTLTNVIQNGTPWLRGTLTEANKQLKKLKTTLKGWTSS